VRYGRLASAGAGALALALTLATSPAPPAHAGTVDPVSWEDCGNGFECATVEVPLDYADPAAGTVELALIRLPAGSPEQRIGSLLLNPGGPGGSGVQAVRIAARRTFSPEVRARFDIVGFDPRGVGADEFRCFPDTAAQLEFWSGLPPFPYTRAQEPVFIDRMAAWTEVCEQRNAARLPYLSTASVARDLDQLRQAVGDERLTFVGYSYGSYLGQVYANMFPQRVRALVLDGVIDPETWANQSPRELTDAAYGGELALDAFAASCAEAGSGCPFGGGDSARKVRARLDAVLAGTRSTPLPAPNADPPGELTYDLAAGAALIAMYDTFFWPEFAAGLARAEAGDGSMLLDFVRPFAPPTDPAAPYDNEEDIWAAVFCTDGTFPHVPKLWPPLVRLSELVAPTFSRYWWYTTLGCATWPGQAAERYAGPWNRPTAAPVLLVNTLADPATAYAGAVRAQRRLADARLITVDGWGHTSLAHPSSCAQQLIDRYLIEQVAPSNGQRCAPDAGPFATTAALADRTSLVPLPPLLGRPSSS
jgi:pimeloyl-ACP methyl ester carboxylesterase